MKKTLLAVVLGLVVLAAAIPAVLSGKVGLFDLLNTGHEVPYFEDFEDEEVLDGEWKVIDLNNDLTTWELYGDGLNFTMGAKIINNHTADDWLISPGIKLEKGVVYRLSFFMRGAAGINIKLDFCIGETAEPAALTTTIWKFESGITVDTHQKEFVVEKDGVYHIGIHADHSDPSSTSVFPQCTLDNFRIDKVLDESAPAAVANLKQVPGTNGAKSMKLTWTNPSTTYNGSQLSALKAIHIYKDKESKAHVYSGSLAPGASASWTDPEPANGSHTYRVIAVGSKGESIEAAVNTFIGVDYPGAPANLKASAEGTKVSLTWEQPEFGRSGGWYDANNVTYRIIRQPGNTVLETAFEGTAYTDEVTSFANYHYEVTTRNGLGYGNAASSNYLVLGKTASLPVWQDFNDMPTMETWSIVDANNDGRTWYVDPSRGVKTPGALVYKRGAENANDEWLFSPPVKLEKGVTYRVSILLATGMFASEYFYITYGKDKTPAAQTNEIESLEGISTDGDYNWGKYTFTPKSNTTAYIGFRAKNVGQFLYLDDVKIERVWDTDIEATGVKNIDTAPTVGTQVTTAVNYENVATQSARNFTVELLDADNNVLGSRKVTRPLAADGKGTAQITWTPKQEGTITVRGRVVYESDQEANNNVTQPAAMNIQPENKKAVTVGTEENLTQGYPVPRWGAVYNQTVYREADFGGYTGIIEQIAYKAHLAHNGNFKNLPFKVWMGVTEKESMNSGWIPASELELVFDGTLDLDNGIYDFMIPLDKPFEYNGGNLTVLFYSDMDIYHLLSDGYGINWYSSEYGIGATRCGNAYIQMDPENPNQGLGSFVSGIPNTMFFFNLDGRGAVRGQVFEADGTTPVKNATVGVDGTRIAIKTDNKGAYSLPYVKQGKQKVTVKAVGYEESAADVQVKEKGEVEQNFKLTVKPKVTLTGKVVGSNDTKTGLQGATVSLTDYADFSAKTDAEGNFTIENVYGNVDYTLVIEAMGYQEYRKELKVGATAQDAGTIVVDELVDAPAQVTAIDRGEAASISWTNPVPAVWLIKDNGENAGQFGGATRYSVAHRYTPAEMEALGVSDDLYVTKVRFYFAANSEFTLKVWQGATNAEQEVYSETLTPQQFDAWYDHTLAKPVKIDKTQNLLVGYAVKQAAGAYPVGFDRGPAKEGGDVLFNNETGEWTTARAVVSNMNYNWNIHVYCSVNPNDQPVVLNKEEEEAPARIVPEESVLSCEEKEIGASAAQKRGQFSYKLKNEALLSARISETPETRKESKPLGYKVWRLQNGYEKQPELWSLLTPEKIEEQTFTDNTWKNLDEQIYRFAVRAVYSNDVMSEPTFSNGVDKGKYAVVTIKAAAEVGSAEGAKVKLYNELETHEGILDANGQVVLENVYFGKYTLRIEKPFFVTSETQVEVKANTQELEDVTLKVDARQPINFSATDYVDNVRLEWGNPTSAVTKNLFKGSENNAGAIGLNTGGTMKIGQRFTSAELTEFAQGEFYVTKMRIFANMAKTCSIKIWRGLENTEMEMYSQEVEITENGWQEVVLERPFRIDAKFSHIFGYEVTHKQGEAPCGFDEGPVVEGGNIIWNQNAWETFSKVSYGAYQCNWNIQAYVTNDLSDYQQQKVLSKANKATEDATVDITYKLYRLNEADKADASKWTAITANAISEMAYTDNTWKGLADGNYLYAIKAVYFGKVEAETLFSKTLQKGRTSLVTVNLATNNEESAAEAQVTFASEENTYYGTVDSEGKCVMPGVLKGAYKMTIAKEGFDTLEENVTISGERTDLSYTLAETKYPAVYVQVKSVDENKAVELSWREPKSYAPQEGWHYWDTNSVYAGFGSSTGTLGVGHMYLPNDLVEKGMKELCITKVSFYIYNTPQNPTDGAFTLKIFKGETELTEAYSQPFTPTALKAWNEVVLDEPFYISGDEALMIGYMFRGTGMPAGIDRGPSVAGKGDMITTGSGWQSLSEANYDYNFLIHAYCVDLGKPEAAQASSSSEQNGEAIHINKGGEMHSALISEPVETLFAAANHPKAKANDLQESKAKGYNVYRFAANDKGDETKWTLLNAQPLTQLNYKDESWQHVADGVHQFAVKALYKSGDAQAAFSKQINSDGTIVGLYNVEGEEILVYPNPSEGEFKVEIDKDAVLSLADLSGRTVYRTDLIAGTNDVTVDLPKGTYVITVTADGDSYAGKIIIE